LAGCPWEIGAGETEEILPATSQDHKILTKTGCLDLRTPDEGLKETQKDFLNAILQGSNEIITAIYLAQDFRVLIEQRQSDKLDDWLKRAEQSHVVEFERFAKSLRADYAAVKAALSYSWSNGQVEGQVNRLKMIKRQMYGRANFGLLRRRVLGPPVNA
jgi:transposase